MNEPGRRTVTFGTALANAFSMTGLQLMGPTPESCCAPMLEMTTARRTPRRLAADAARWAMSFAHAM